MSTATTLKQQKPALKAIGKETKGMEAVEPVNFDKKKWMINKTVLLTWLVLIALTVVFWYSVLKIL